MNHVYNDGGRAAAGYKGETGDCACRAIAIATEQPYQVVYDALNKLDDVSKARTGVSLPSLRKYLAGLGWIWTPTMKVGVGCKVHLRADELPAGRVIVRLSRHLATVIDGVLYDTHDCSREGSRCVYGYFTQEE